jgi:hypothetical protein
MRAAGESRDKKVISQKRYVVELYMKYKKLPENIYSIEAIGFFAIITLSWANEIIGLPGIIFGGPVTPNWREAIIETFIALLVWSAVHVMTRKTLKRLYYLEEFLRVCAWCRKIGYNNEWIPIEEYFSREYATKTSHGVCPECAKKLCEEKTPV